MSGQGRPLRFVGAVLGGWTMLRIWALWPQAAPIPVLIRALAPPVAAAVETRPAPRGRLSAPRPKTAGPSESAAASTRPRATADREPDVAGVSGPGSSEPAWESLAAQRSSTPAGVEQLVPIAPIAPLPPPDRARPSRLSGSAWLLARNGAQAAAALGGGQLGGSQAGVRLNYAIDGARRLAVTARLSAPLHGAGREAAFGLAWRPTRIAVTLVAEQRVSLDGGRGGPALGVIAGVNPTPVAAGFRLEAYGQAGAIKRDVVEGFADGAARLTRPVHAGRVRLDLGAGAWGGAQRGAARLDVGPTVGVALPVAGRSLRLTLDWRERVAGSARPGSGPALSLGTDF